MLSPRVIEAFEQAIGKENVQHSNAARLSYAYDATANYHALPDLIVSPKNTTDVQAIVKLCQEYELPIVPRGSGTNLAAGTTPTEGGVVVLFRHMNQILSIDEENLTVTV